jgi:hypothetical protein
MMGCVSSAFSLQDGAKSQGSFQFCEKTYRQICLTPTCAKSEQKSSQRGDSVGQAQDENQATSKLLRRCSVNAFEATRKYSFSPQPVESQSQSALIVSLSAVQCGSSIQLEN